MDYTKNVTDFVNNVFDQPSDIQSIVSGLYDEKALIHGPLGRQMGSLSVEEHWKRWITAFDDNNAEFELISGKNTVIGLWTVKGKHVGRFGDIEPTGKQVICKGISTYQFNDIGKVCSHHYHADLAGVYEQMGYHLVKEAYPKQSQMKSDYLLLLNTLKKMGQKQDILTNREVIIMTFYLQGRTAREIGERFKINFRTAQTHLNNGMHKLGCRSKSQLQEFVSSVGLTYVFRDFYDLILHHKESS